MNDEANAVLNHGIDAAVEHLSKHGEFYPFALFGMPGGQVVLVSTYSGEEQPEAGAFLAELENAVRVHALDQHPAAIGIVRDTWATNQETGARFDAICVHVEDEDTRDAVDCFVPYRRVAGRVECGEMIAQACPKTLF